MCECLYDKLGVEKKAYPILFREVSVRVAVLKLQKSPENDVN